MLARFDPLLGEPEDAFANLPLAKAPYFGCRFLLSFSCSRVVDTLVIQTDR